MTMVARMTMVAHAAIVVFATTVVPLDAGAHHSFAVYSDEVTAIETHWLALGESLAEPAYCAE